MTSAEYVNYGTDRPEHDCSVKAGYAQCPHCLTWNCPWCMAIHLRDAHAAVGAAKK